MARILIIVFLLSISKNVLANSCCGQSPSSFTVLSLEQTLSITTAYSYIQSQGRVYNDSNEFYLWDSKKRQIQSIKFNVASAFKSRQQIFLSSAVLKGSYADKYEEAHSQNLSDTQFGYSYELLPEYSYSPWKPTVFLSFLLNLPTGKSIYDSVQLSEGAGVTGHNQWGAGLGVTLKKVYFPLTVTLQTKVLRILPKEFSSVRVSGFYDSSVALLSNYVTPYWNLALNLGLTFNHLSARSIQPSNTTSEDTQNTTILIGLQRPIDDQWSAGINYADQTLLGSPRNTVLNKTYSFNINYNYF